MNTNKNMSTVFADILDTEDRIGKLNKFLKAANFMDPNQNKYQDLLDLILPKLKELSSLEEIILQTRAWNNLQSKDIKIISNRGYIYVRTSFYRRDKAANEIRILIGKQTDWLNEKYPTVDNLYDNEDFLAIAKNVLSRAMEKVIHQNVDNYKIKYRKEKV